VEMKAYVDGIARKWWLIGVILVLSFWIGRIVDSSQTFQFTASTSILINGPVLAQTAVPSGVVQISTPLSYAPQVAPPGVLDYILKHYPRLTYSRLQRAIVFSTDSDNRILLINVTDIFPQSAVDIANYLAQQFVRTQKANLYRQLDYYQNWLQQNIPVLTGEINRLNLQIQQLTPPPAPRKNATPIDPNTQRTLSTDQYTLDLDERNLYNYQQALRDIQNTRPLFTRAYVVIKPASELEESVIAPPSASVLESIALAAGLVVAICLIVTMDYFTPFVRHKGELSRIVGLPVLAELPNIPRFEQKRLLQLRRPFFRWRTKALRQICYAIGALVIKEKGRTLLLTSPRKKRDFAAVLATFLAYNGHQTLLIDADFENPHPPEQLELLGPCKLATNKGMLLPLIQQTSHPHLFVLPAAATINQNERMTSISLMALLPELQQVFSIIIIDAPPLNCADTHLLATKVSQSIFLVRKRRDSLKNLKIVHMLSQELKLNSCCLLLT
jgi:capsular polysaccharide biosynthesis protein